MFLTFNLSLHNKSNNEIEQPNFMLIADFCSFYKL